MLYVMWDSLCQVLTFSHRTILCAVRTVLWRVEYMYIKHLQWFCAATAIYAENDTGYKERMPSISSLVRSRNFLPWRYRWQKEMLVMCISITSAWPYTLQNWSSMALASTDGISYDRIITTNSFILCIHALTVFSGLLLRAVLGILQYFLFLHTLAIRHLMFLLVSVALINGNAWQQVKQIFFEAELARKQEEVKTNHQGNSSKEGIQ